MIRNEFVGNGGDQKHVHGEQKERAEINETYHIDIRKRWTEYYPHIYFNFKPRYINWEEERIFYAKSPEKDREDSFYKKGKKFENQRVGSI